MDVDPWIEHLNNPLVLVGFVLFVLASLMKVITPDNLKSKSVERLWNRGMTFTFILSFLIVLFAFAYAFMQIRTGHQSTAGDNSPAIISNGGVIVNYDEQSLSQQKKGSLPPSPTEPSSTVEQQTQGEQSPAIDSSGDVIIQY